MADFTAGLLAGDLAARRARRAARDRARGRGVAARRGARGAGAAVRGGRGGRRRPAPAAREPATPDDLAGAGRARARVRGARALLPRLPRGRRLLRAHVPERGAAPHDAGRARARGPVRRRPAGAAGVRGRARARARTSCAASRRCSPSAPAAHWIRRLRAAGVPAAQVRTLDRLYDDPQAHANGLVQEVAAPGRRRRAAARRRLQGRRRAAPARAAASPRSASTPPRCSPSWRCAP